MVIHTDWLQDLIIALTLCQVFFFRNLEKSKQFAILLGVEPSRAYSDYNEMAENERKRDDGIEFIFAAKESSNNNSSWIKLDD